MGLEKIGGRGYHFGNAIHSLGWRNSRIAGTRTHRNAKCFTLATNSFEY